MRWLALVLIVVFFVVGSTYSQNVSNHGPAISMEKDVLRYNAMEKEWKYVPQKSELRYHPFEKKWDYVEPEKQLRYNAIERRWEWAR